METSKHAIQIMAQVQESKLKFANLGSFLLEFFMLSVNSQEQLANNLLALSKNEKLDDYYVIKGFYKAACPVERVGLVLVHSFKCKGCGFVIDAETNSFGGRLRQLCEMCENIAQEYEREHDDWSVTQWLHD